VLPVSGVVRLLPAWDMKHSTEFELNGRDGFRVRAGVEHGVIAPVMVTSTLGGKCGVVNRWGGPVSVGSEDGKGLTHGEVLRSKSRKGVRYTLARAPRS
jgi:hypothetical protein